MATTFPSLLPKSKPSPLPLHCKRAQNLDMYFHFPANVDGLKVLSWVSIPISSWLSDSKVETRGRYIMQIDLYTGYRYRRDMCLIFAWICELIRISISGRSGCLEIGNVWSKAWFLIGKDELPLLPSWKVVGVCPVSVQLTSFCWCRCIFRSFLQAYSSKTGSLICSFPPIL